MSDRAYYTVPRLGRVEVGPMLPSERGFVLHSWTEQLTHQQGHGRNSGSPHRAVYLAGNGAMTERSLAECTVLVARDAEERARAYGWLAVGDVDGELTVLWVSVKRDYRLLGIARLLVDEARDRLGSVLYYARRGRNDVVMELLGLEHRPVIARSA